MNAKTIKAEKQVSSKKNIAKEQASSSKVGNSDKKAVTKTVSEKKAKSMKDQGLEAKVFVKNIRVSPLKLNLVARSIRGLACHEALNELTFSKKAVALDVKKALLSAMANAQNNYGMNADKLIVKSAYVGKGLVMKRFRARAKGRGVKILKPFSHLFITVAQGGQS